MCRENFCSNFLEFYQLFVRLREREIEREREKARKRERERKRECVAPERTLVLIMSKCG